MSKKNYLNRHSELISESSQQVEKTLKRVQGDYGKSRKLIAQKGFTIIEIIIVMAIGALILLMSFAVINTGQRSKRDTQRKADLAKINQDIASVANNSHGILPTTLSGLPLPPGGGAYTPHYTAVSTACPGKDHVYYERLGARSYKIKICLEAGDYTEDH